MRDVRLGSAISTADVRARARQHAWAVTVWAAVVAWVVVLFGIVRVGFLDFRVGRFDLGNMVQAVWSTAHGRPLEVTHGATGEQMLRLGGHVDPFLALLAPLWIVWPSPLALALAQIVVVALGALPVYWLARVRLGSERLAGLLALAYLAYPWVATSAAASIHPVTFGITFLLLCVWFLETNRLWPFALFALLAMSTGELMGLPVAGLGAWYGLAHGRRRAGGAIAFAGLAWTAIAVYFVVPAVRGGGSMFYGFYEEAGGSPQGVVGKLVTDPLAVARLLLESHDLTYLLWLGLPLLFLFLLSPGLAAVALPQLLANGLSDFRSMTDPRYHSVAAVIPFLIAATVLGVGRLPGHRRSLSAAAVLTCCLSLALVVGPWPRALGVKPLGGRENVAPARVDALREAVATVPDDAPLTSSNAAGAHLSARRYLYSVPIVGRAEWALVDLGDPWVVTEDSPILTRDPAAVTGMAERLRADPTWRLVFERDGVLVFRRLAR